MTLIKIPKSYLVSEDEHSIIVDIPESMLLNWQKDYGKISQAKGILTHKREEMLTHLNILRQEWDE